MARGRRIVTALTKREREVLLLLSRGLSNAAIADELGLRYYTIRTHVASIFLKLGVGNRTHAALVGMASGIVPVPKRPEWRAESALLVDSIAGEA
jgi:DNA-binding NarL/FixJ family response regulator